MLLIAMPYCISKSCSVVSDSLQPHRLYSPWNSPGQNTGVSRYWKISRGSSHPGIEPRSPALQVDSLPAEPQGKTKNTGVGGLSLLQGIFLTQELNPGPLHCRWILYQLSSHAKRKPDLKMNVICFPIGFLFI